MSEKPLHGAPELEDARAGRAPLPPAPNAEPADAERGGGEARTDWVWLFEQKSRELKASQAETVTLREQLAEAQAHFRAARAGRAAAEEALRQTDRDRGALKARVAELERQLAALDNGQRRLVQERDEAVARAEDAETEIGKLLVRQVELESEAGRAARRAEAAEREVERLRAPVPMILHCPSCNARPKP